MDATHTPEEWRPIPGYEGSYEVSDQGRVRSLPRQTYTGLGRPILGGILAHALVSGRGYPTVTLYRGGNGKAHRVHRLVLEAFVGPCPQGMMALHANDVATDNRIANLRWGTMPENVADSLRNGTNTNAAKTHCKHGHEFTPENIRFDRRGRQCLECDRTRAAADRKRVNDDPDRLARKREYNRAWMREKRAKEYAERCQVQTTTQGR